MRILVVLLLSASLSGCLVELLTTTAIQGELQAQNANAATRVLGKVKEDQAMMTAQRGVDAYRADKGALPGSLEELVPTYLAAVPMMPDGTAYGYDPNTGRVLDHAYDPLSPTPQDQQTMVAIRAAINAYGTATGYYPPSLDDLAPHYLPQAPRTVGGEAFVYDNQNGHVAHPRAGQVPQPARQGGGTAVGGGGPLGETMTGIGIQQQLSSGSQAGVNAAGPRGRQSAGGIADGNTQRQTEAMDNLGL